MKVCVCVWGPFLFSVHSTICLNTLEMHTNTHISMNYKIIKEKSSQTYLDQLISTPVLYFHLVFSRSRSRNRRRSENSTPTNPKKPQTALVQQTDTHIAGQCVGLLGLHVGWCDHGRETALAPLLLVVLRVGQLWRAQRQGS